MTQLMTSLAEIRSFNPCRSGFVRVATLKRLENGEDALFPLIECCDTNTFAEVCWLLGKRKTEIRIAVNAAKMCSASVAGYITTKTDADYAAQAVKYAKYAANCFAKYATYAADHAANHAAHTADYATYAARIACASTSAYAIAKQKQREKNMNFLRQCILEYEAQLAELPK